MGQWSKKKEFSLPKNWRSLTLKHRMGDLINGKKVRNNFIYILNLFQAFYNKVIQVCQGSTYLFEVLSWKFILSATLCWMNKDESIDLNKFSQPRTIYFLQLLKTDLLSEATISQVQATFIRSNLADFEHVNGRWNTLLT